MPTPFQAAQALGSTQRPFDAQHPRRLLPNGYEVTEVRISDRASSMIATFTLVIFDVARVKGCRLMNGTNGMFVGGPSRQTFDGAWLPIVTLDRAFADALCEELRRRLKVSHPIDETPASSEQRSARATPHGASGVARARPAKVKQTRNAEIAERRNALFERGEAGLAAAMKDLR